MSLRERLRGRLIVAPVAAGLALAPVSASAEAPRVVASIKPIHSLVAGVLEGVATPALVVQGAGSPHTYSLRPSDARALDEADVVFWIGPNLETFLEKPIRALSPDAEVVQLAEAESLTLLPTREGGIWEEHAAEHASTAGHHDEGHAQAHQDEHHAHAHGEFDMHLWLDPRNAEVMVGRIARVLTDADPDHAAIYQANAARLQAQLADLDAALAEKLAPVRDRPFLVFHDGYHYLEHRYGLAAAGAISVDPERRPGARRLGEIREHVEELDIACVFAEPQFEPALVETVVDGTDAKAAVLDPLGAGLDAGPAQYFELMNELADSLVACLGAAEGH